MGALGTCLGLNMEMKNNDWRSPITGMMFVRWGHWKDRVLRPELQLYTDLDTIIEMASTARQGKLFL